MDDAKTLITADPGILVGKPIVRGTRISVELVLGMLADGWSHAQILENYPTLTEAAILACIAYAKDVVASEKLYHFAAE